MSVSVLLEVAIGLVFFFLLLSLVCTSATEMLSHLLSMRSKVLEKGIRNLLSDQSGTGLAAEVYRHPIILGLAEKGKTLAFWERVKKPSYIPSRTFSIALFDTILPASGQKPKTIEEFRTKVAGLENVNVRRSLLALLDASENKIDKARQKVESWFDDGMDRVTGWYKRWGIP